MNDAWESAETVSKNRHALAGTLLLGGGLILILTRALETAYGIPGLPRSWYQNDWLWWLLGLAGIGVGSRLLARSESDVDSGRRWKPTLPGRRFRELVLYTRRDCHLCEEASEMLAAHRNWLPSITRVDIDTDPDLVRQFGTCVPVVALDGTVRFRGKVQPVLLRRLIEGTPPGRTEFR